MKQPENVLRRFSKANVSVTSDTTNSRIPPANLSASASEFGFSYSPIEILDEMFNSACNLLQDPVPIVQCLESEGYLVKCKSNPNQPHHMKLNKNGSFACDTNCTKFKSYRICSHKIAVAEKERHLKKPLGFVRPNQPKFYDLVATDVSKNTGKKCQKATQRRKGTKQVKENPVMYCSGSNTNKDSLVHSCESDTIVSSASLSETNQTEFLALSSHGR